MQPYIPLLVTYLTSIDCLAQENIGLKLDGGVSRITSHYMPVGGSFSTSFAPSGTVGAFYNIKTSDHAFVGIELLFSRIGGKERFEGIFYDLRGNSLGTGYSHITRRISYLSIPVYYGFVINRSSFTIGPQVSFEAFSSLNDRGMSVLNDSITEWDHKLNDVHYKDTDWGVKVTAICAFNNYFDFTLSYYHGIRNLYSILGFGKAVRINQILIGLRYSLWSTKTANEPLNKH